MLQSKTLFNRWFNIKIFPVGIVFFIETPTVKMAWLHREIETKVHYSRGRAVSDKSFITPTRLSFVLYFDCGRLLCYRGLRSSSWQRNFSVNVFRVLDTVNKNYHSGNFLKDEPLLFLFEFRQSSVCWKRPRQGIIEKNKTRWDLYFSGGDKH